MTMGFGQASSLTLSNWATLGVSNTPSNFYRFVIFSNVWQFLVSVLYIQYNAIASSMLANREWMRYTECKPLRVTQPVGWQRSSYFVSMPFRYGVPLITTSSFLHYSLSQSVFVVALEQIDKAPPEKLLSRSFLTFNGFSVWAIITCEFPSFRRKLH